jgi:carbon-monoxide dehydrogenase large subunit
VIRNENIGCTRIVNIQHQLLFAATGEDVRADGLGDVPCMVPLVNRDGTPRHDTPRPVLALGKVRHVGQPVALIVAETLTAARDVAEAIEVEYDPLPTITEAKDAISPGAPQLFDHIPSNIVFDWDNEMGDAKATEAAFSRAARVVTLELVNNRVVVNSMEPVGGPRSGRWGPSVLATEQKSKNTKTSKVKTH